VREIFTQLELDPSVINAAAQLYSKTETELTDFEFIMKDHFDLIVEIRDRKLKHSDIEDRLIKLKVRLAKLIKSNGFIPNTGQMPSELTRTIQVRRVCEF
jgi:hypothetical protein